MVSDLTQTVEHSQQTFSMGPGKMERAESAIPIPEPAHPQKETLLEKESARPLPIPQSVPAASVPQPSQPVRRTQADAKPKRTISPWIWITGLVLVGLACLAVAISGGWVTSLMLRQPAQTSEIIDTPQANQDQPQVVVQDDSTNLEQLKNSAYWDDFSDPKSGWMVYQGTEGSMGYHSGTYQFQIDQTNLMLYSTPGYSVADALVQVEAYKSGGPDENIFGIICRYQDENNYYFLTITSNGYYGIGKITDGATSLIGTEEMQYNSAINQGRTSNTLQATCQSDHLALAVNGTKLVEVQDSLFANGAVGLIAGTYDIYGANILFDNFAVTTLSEP
jgi:hypothetical protein